MPMHVSLDNELQPSLFICSCIATQTLLRMKKLRDLHLKRNEARKLNHQEVVEEDRRNKEPKNMEARRRRAEYVLQEEALKAECDAKGKDWEIEKLRNLGADEADALDKRKKSKQNPDEGFSSYEQVNFFNK